MKNNYFHTEIPEITTDFLNEGVIVVRHHLQPSYSQILDIALLGYRIALRIGIKPPVLKKELLPYSNDNDNLIFSCPLTSILLGKRMHFLRGWKQFDSCIKGFNSVGLIADHVRNQLNAIEKMEVEELCAIKKSFLLSRKNENGEKIFQSTDIENQPIENFTNIHALDIALWKCFSDRTIVCSTSSNMGISLHQFLRYLQKTTVKWQSKEFYLFNKDEGELIIWCPDEEADFMNKEKSDLLRSLERENPPLTKLHTYINRIQRDPGALRDALLCGGYFFPTNPQSSDEIQNLLFVAMNNIASERNQNILDLLGDSKIMNMLTSLGCEVEEDKIYVNKGVEGGISGLMIPYLLLLEETIGQGKAKAISSWNQASIGAALAAAVIADMIIRSPENLSEHIRAELNTLFPNISKFLDNKKLGKDIETRVHGVFDLANLQSLAQLLGVVVEKHLSGRGTAYVGLGSSSYSNGNRCYEILRDSMESNGPFKGKSTFHPATHTLNPFAQALIYGEELFRLIKHTGETSGIPDVALVQKHVKKAEPAGAAALAGYLLSRLDRGTLSLVEIAYTLKVMGFTKPLFLQFCNLPADEQGVNKFLQEASEEGRYMGDLARNIFLILDWSIEKVEKNVEIERAHSTLKYNLYPIDDLGGNSLEHIYLTGDNTSQPGENIIRSLISAQLANKQKIENLIKKVSISFNGKSGFDSISFTSSFFNKVSRNLLNIDKQMNKMVKRIINYQISVKIKKINENGKIK